MMKTLSPFPRLLLSIGLFCLTLVVAFSFVVPVAHSDEWVNYYNAPDIVYDVAVEGYAAEQAKNSLKYMVWVATESGLFQIDTTHDTFRRYTYADGLSSNFVRSIMMDVEVAGHRDKWFGTSNGELNMFDDTTWYTYLSPDLTGINHIAVDGSGTLWLGRGDFVTAYFGLGGLHSFDGTDWTVYNFGNSDLTSNYVEAVVVDGSGTLWLGTCPPPPLPPPLCWFIPYQPGGLNLFDGTDWTDYQKADGLAGNNVYDLAFDSLGTAWMATLLNGVSAFDGATWTTYDTSNSGLPVNQIQAVAIDGSDNKWFGSCCNGVALFGGTTWTVYDTATSGIANDNVHDIDIYETQNGKTEIWLGTSAGVSRFQTVNNKWTTFAFDGILNADYVAVAVDGLDNKWFGANAGLSHFDGATWTVYDTATSGLVSDTVRAVAVDSTNTVWAGTNAGLSSFDGTAWTSYTTADSGLVSNTISALAIDSTDIVWVGTNAGLSRFDGATATWTSYTTADSGLVSDTVSSLAIDGSGVLWIGTNAGLSRFDDTTATWTGYTTADGGLASDSVSSLAVDSSDMVWIGTNAGLSSFDGATTWATYDVASGDLITDTIYAVTVDNSDNVWIGTDAGAGRFDGATWTHFTCGDGIADSDVRGIAAESDDDMWFATGNGVSSYIKSVVVPPANPDPTVDLGPGMSFMGDIVLGSAGGGCFVSSLN